jgi:hypothetical protein
VRSEVSQWRPSCRTWAWPPYAPRNRYRIVLRHHDHKILAITRESHKMPPCFPLVGVFGLRREPSVEGRVSPLTRHATLPGEFGGEQEVSNTHAIALFFRIFTHIHSPHRYYVAMSEAGEATVRPLEDYKAEVPVVLLI